MRGSDLVISPDCVAAGTAEDRRRALAQVRRALEADTRPSTALDLKQLVTRDRTQRKEQT